MVRPARLLLTLVAGATTIVMAGAGFGNAVTAETWTGAYYDHDRSDDFRAAVPEDRYAMAGGCYALRSETAGYIARTADGFAATGQSSDDAEPFHFQATDLGRYLLFGTAEDFLAASEGLAGQVAYGATQGRPGEEAGSKLQPGGIVGGVALEQTDRAADEIARSPVNEASGRGASVVAAPKPSNLADWEIVEAGEGTFAITLPETGQALAAQPDGTLDLPENDPTTPHPFSIELTDACAKFPEIEVNVEGGALGGQTSFQEVRGYFDAHLHMMAFEFLGGRARCGRPWHRFGVEYALVDCPDHEPQGFGAVLEAVVSRKTDTRHNTDGWPTFEGWPRHDSLTHEQVYYKWLERAWRGGLRMFTNLLVDNNVLCEVYPFKRNSCNEMDGVRLQAQRIRELERYIDAQSGGPGEGWFRIVTDPFEAREVINAGKLAVVLGIEVSVPLDCGLTLDSPRCNEDQIVAGLDEVYDLGVRQMELVNKFDNAFSGIAGDSGDTGIVVNTGNFAETGRFWRMETCEEHEHEHAHDKLQHNFHDNTGAPDEFSGRDGLAGAILALTGTSGVAPIYPEGPHCNILGLSELGKRMIREMAARGIIFDPDHMSARAQTQALDFIEEEIEVNGYPYSGLVSSHGWSNDTIYPRIYELGGVVTPYAGSSAGFASEWAKHREWQDDRYYFGFGYGADTNGFGSQGPPRGADVTNPVTYPITGLGGAMIDQQHSGSRVYDINADGVAHYGLYPDWIEDLRVLAGDEIIQDMERGPEAYLQMWERAIGILPDACRPDVPDLEDESLKALSKGMTPRQVLEALGQPSSRIGNKFTYCMSDGDTATVIFTSEGTLDSWKAKKEKIHGHGPPADPGHGHPDHPEHGHTH